MTTQTKRNIVKVAAILDDLVWAALVMGVFYVVYLAAYVIA